jgi:hypothetical protein
MSEMSKVHIWIGTTEKDEEAFAEYFEQDYSTEGDFDDPEYKVCGFCEDIGEKWYDEDFLGVGMFDSAVEVKELLYETVIKVPEAYDAACAKCAELGITGGNMVFYYTDANLVVADSNKKYNGLQYLGLFDSELI